MAKAAKRLIAILDYMKKVKSNISRVFGLVSQQFELGCSIAVGSPPKGEASA